MTHNVERAGSHEKRQQTTHKGTLEQASESQAHPQPIDDDGGPDWLEIGIGNGNGIAVLPWFFTDNPFFFFTGPVPTGAQHVHGNRRRNGDSRELGRT